MKTHRLISSLMLVVLGALLMVVPAAGQTEPPYFVYLPAIFNISSECSTAPTLIAPANGSALNTLLPLFQWDAGSEPNATHLYLTVANDAAFTVIRNGLRTSSVSGPDEFRFDDNFDPAITYYWRAYMECGEVHGPYSSTWSFITLSGGTFPAAPNLVEPANGSVVSSLPVTLRWGAVSDANRYLVRWRPVGDYVYPYASLDATHYSPSSLDPGTTYEWWVSAINDYAIGPDSSKWQFTTPASGAPFHRLPFERIFHFDPATGFTWL